jgi:Uma2 family endonuclease
MTVQLARRLFTVDDYYRMAEAGILHEDDRVELINGEIVEMVPIGSHHASVVMRLNYHLSRLVPGEQAMLSVQGPVRLNKVSEPQPDIVLLRPRADFYGEGHPTASDILLLIEVADSSLDADREVKLPLYAEVGVVECWIVDLKAQRVEVYRSPSERSYQVQMSFAHGDGVAPEVLPDVKLRVSEILG